ncbi:MAG: hypothetical protein COV69_00725 [Parcubacteria group bacterium CG11_big_fil_rev_8_21_14_0_20_39_14]|nr:MAG: hypothetical protein COV69_00725 [Parcubacteria group bacterium CG11_big_fil_rev_8_21_14_0_20_39_14]PIS35725.1 MAG: hypothetical protein COT36_00660 [Parcubacteria group bacterium CG08_land_8_20_14_0_20_38_56]
MFEKLQKKSEKTKTKIFWVALIISVGIIGFFWLRNLGHYFENLKTESGKIKKSSGDILEDIKKELPPIQLREKVKQLEETSRLEIEEFEKLFEEEKRTKKEGDAQQKKSPAPK